ncbi:hypothetical protein [Flavobacterium sp. KACC 22761]|uniref:hypothetical protein n=1 Tax=Flavobacterium sp. KACC 22761 TaxID=3092665 RepID=UPI002A748380|nr:hypothetical protein [Flavobacterium sp. KACC 22761]WPO77898.1 hypothetical protein SCB73_16635 [Flavobacterium sp. KACC 22761]
MRFNEDIKKIICFFLFGSLQLFSQSSMPVADQLAEQLHSLDKNNCSDLVYIQTSKSIYETEEDVWFKGYVLDAQYFAPSQRNKTLFVQLIEDKTDKVVWEKKYEIENGFVNGHLFLENSLSEGTYTLAGYSSNSFSGAQKEFYALKKLEIVKTITQKPVAKTTEKDSVFHFSTFAEGGRLVSGIQSTLAFKAVNSKGLPVEFSGTLYENDIPLQHFKSIHAGMGALVFTPNRDKKYHIKIEEPALNKVFPIGEIDANGKGLQLLSNSKGALVFKISQSDALPEEKIYLRLQVRGVVYSVAIGMLKKDLIIKIPLTDVPQGIAEVTLFNENVMPVAERLVYVNEDQKLTIKTMLEKTTYAAREQVNVKIKATDQNNQPIVAHLGLSVYDALYQNKQDAKNIQTHYFLSSQLKGTIYDPIYYFEEKNKNREQALNLLMLTQGWRNYVWDEESLREIGNIFKPIVFDEMKGKVQLKKADSKVKNEFLPKGISVFSGKDENFNELIITDSTGVFSILPTHLKLGDYTYMRLLTPSESNYRMNIKDFSFDQIDGNRNAKTIIYPISEIEVKKVIPEADYQFTSREAITKLSEVLITQKKKKTVFRDKYIGKLDSLARAQYFTTDYVCHNTLNCPLWLCHKGEKKKPVEGERYETWNGFKWINGECSPYTITSYGSIVYHYPDLTEAELLDMFNIAMVEGYYGKKVFYEAVYDNVTITDPLPDYRNTLFWKPDIITNELGEATVSFFCSDISSLFLGNIEGVSGDGLIGAENIQFMVKKK